MDLTFRESSCKYLLLRHFKTSSGWKNKTVTRGEIIQLIYHSITDISPCPKIFLLILLGFALVNVKSRYNIRPFVFALGLRQRLAYPLKRHFDSNKSFMKLLCQNGHQVVVYEEKIRPIHYAVKSLSGIKFSIHTHSKCIN